MQIDPATRENPESRVIVLQNRDHHVTTFFGICQMCSFVLRGRISSCLDGHDCFTRHSGLLSIKTIEIVIASPKRYCCCETLLPTEKHDYFPKTEDLLQPRNPAHRQLTIEKLAIAFEKRYCFRETWDRLQPRPYLFVTLTSTERHSKVYMEYQHVRMTQIVLLRAKHDLVSKTSDS
jgi:hypothetical protein